ncbi:helix-turn-helix domain-containing protein [Streptomyces sparsogenes]|uniref:helix-turn-helix domain-containing protein n=1 Tax=Streptomyces sparsogenes TaxID=67365 RepID=UPI00384F84FF
MIETVFRTSGLSRGDRFDCWHEQMVKLHAPMHITSDYADDFCAEMRIFQLDSVCVWPGTVQPTRYQRTPRLIRQGDPEAYHLTLMLHGEKTLVQGNQQDTCGPLDIQILDTSRPYDALACLPGREPLKVIGIEVPKNVVPMPLDHVDQLVTHPLSGREGFGALLAGFVTQLVSDADSYRSSDGPLLQGILIDLVSALLAGELEAESHLAPETRTRTLALQVQSFIRKHLGDPDLTPAAIASAHHISVSHLHRVFKVHGQGATVAGWIRRHRLEQARRDLNDPAQRALPVHEIGARWGFSHHAAFTRAFRAAYGIPPRDYRHQELVHLARNARPVPPATDRQGTGHSESTTQQART